LYCDWVWSVARHLARKRRLFGSTRHDNLRYLKCRAPLVHEVDRLRRYCDEQQIAVLDGDSVALACDGKLIDDDAWWKGGSHDWTTVQDTAGHVQPDIDWTLDRTSKSCPSVQSVLSGCLVPTKWVEAGGLCSIRVGGL
jgi:hypothetical protein